MTPGADAGAAPEQPNPTDSKLACVIALLKREQGATLAELVETTGWLPHTTRAALTGLKKKGHVIAKTKRGETTCHRIVAATAGAGLNGADQPWHARRSDRPSAAHT